MKQAVCALIFREEYKILAVSRKDDPTAFGLIGGKVDEGETPEEALIRETKEETGLDVISYEKIFERTDGDFKCTTYLCEVDGEIQTTEKGVVKEVGWTELLSGPFGVYNRQLLDHMRSQLQQN
jgi:8-oxo-dGTP pyrophosphatase MutT (NUDIX family)